MSSKSLSKNSAYYLLYNVFNVLFPLASGIYVARVLLPQLIGEVAYAQNIATYFSILAFLGIPTYGMREIARNREDKDALKKIHSELLIINAISTSVFLLSYIVLVLSVADFRGKIVLYLIVGVSIALNYLNNAWLFQGLEEFKYISIRNIFFKVFLFVLLVVFVRKEDDYIAYAIVASIGSAGAYFLNIIIAKKKVGFTLKGLELKRHLKPIFLLVVVNIAIEIYTLVDTTMLGIFCDKLHVAFYSYGSKIYKVLLQILNTFTVVVVPRMSLFFKNKQTDDFYSLVTKTLKIIVLIAIPAIIGIQFVSDFLVVKVYGEAYSYSATVIRILCFNLLISPIGYLLGSRMMLVVGKEYKMIIAVGIGCAINIVGNFLLIPLYSEIGAAVASVISELIVAVVYVSFGSRYFRLKSMKSFSWKILLATIIMSAYLVTIGLMLHDTWIKLIVQVVGAAGLYFLTLVFTKETTVRDTLSQIKGRMIRRQE